jgi:phytanoyl-CoA hydroxylase
MSNISNEKISHEERNGGSEKFVEHYHEHGFAVAKAIIPSSWCEHVMTSFDREIRNYKGHLYRQTTADPERHRLDACGRIQNPLLNPVSVRSALFPGFRRDVLNVLASNELFGHAEQLLGSAGMLVQSMFFEGGLGTWAHQDTYYLDSEKIGSMAAAWIALEDIDEGAGRFFVGVDSHKIDMAKNGGDFDIAFNHERYKQLVQDIIRRNNVKIMSPALKQGDVLFWNGKTIHGSHAPTNCRTRKSLTAHFIPAHHRYLKFQSIPVRLKPSIINGHACHLPKDQDLWIHRAALKIETTFPKTYKSLKKIALKAATGKSR